MNVVLARTETATAMDSLFTASRDRLPGTGKVAETRRLAFEAFERAGLPHRRIEEWKYTDLRALMRERLRARLGVHPVVDLVPAGTLPRRCSTSVWNS